jgi:hypothetical protein
MKEQYAPGVHRAHTSFPNFSQPSQARHPVEAETVYIVKIDIQEREGYLYARSPDLPGLHVCRETEEGLRESVFLAVKTLFKANRKLDVAVRSVAPSLDQFPRDGGTLDRLAVLPC